MSLPHIEKHVQRLRREGKTYEQISKALGMSAYAVRKILNPHLTEAWPSRSKSKRDQVSINAQDGVEPAPPKKPDWSDWVAHLKEIQGFKKIDPSEATDEVTIEFHENLPVAVSIFSDIHCGDAGVTYDLLDKHVQLVKQTPGMYCVFNGDELNNFLGGLSYAGRGDLVQNDEQWQIVEALFDELHDSVLTVTKGNHNAWTVRHAGTSLQSRILERFNLVDIGEGARLFLSLGEQIYVVMLRHRYRYNSAMNPGHAVMKMHDEHGPFDLGIIGHTHEAAIGWQVKQNRRIAYIRPGSYKIVDDYAESMGFPRSIPLSPTVILFPDEKKMQLFDNIADAADALGYYREQYKRRLELK